ncbi:MAG TPA: D-alanyl-D-alanine carboxypeptidase/D-alanyl-D-alanine-endopeptidase [Gaiellaceae bacterium]|nr:D-alanyl-D-alanine carboxypeptidase/D-alanyl-D-alanine-endopeptidase [Gaiellaceae bacterium]
MRRRLAASLALLVLAAPVSTAAAPTPRTALKTRLARALRVPHVSPARSAGVAIDLATGATVYSQNATRSLEPASNEKLPVTYAALSLLGPAYRFETDVLGEGSLEGTVWHGALVLKGSGDPTLSTAGLRSLAAQLRVGGVRRVDGGIVADESWFDTRRTVAGWKPSFYLDESPPLSALVVDRDRLASGRLSTNPALAAGQEFRTALRSAGIAVTGTVRMGLADDFSNVMASVFSPTLASIVRFMDRESDNFTAEMLLKQLGATQSEHGTSAAGAAVVTQALAAAGVPLAGVRIVDGSGLSLLDRLTAAALTTLLRVSWQDPTVRPTLLAALPVAGVNGTLDDRMRTGPAHGTVLAKTGTTSEASALSGYVRSRYVFAILQNGHPLAYWWARVAQDRFAQVLAAE